MNSITIFRIIIYLILLYLKLLQSTTVRIVEEYGSHIFRNVIAPSYRQENNSVYFLAGNDMHLNIFSQVYIFSLDSYEFRLALDSIPHGELITAAPSNLLSGDIYFVINPSNPTLYQYEVTRNIALRLTEFISIKIIPGYTSAAYLPIVDAFYFLSLEQSTGRVLLMGYNEELDNATHTKAVVLDAHGTYAHGTYAHGNRSLNIASDGILRLYIFGTENPNGKEANILRYDGHGISELPAKLPENIKSNVFCSYERAIAMFVESNNIAIFDRREVISVVELDYGGIDTSFTTINAIYIEKDRDIFAFVCGRNRTFGCSVLRISGLLEVKDELMRYFVVEGSSFNMTCSISGNPTPELVWNRDEDPYVDLSDNVTLIFEKVTSDQTGEYTCLGGNAFGSVAEKHQLNVKRISDVKPTRIIHWAPHKMTKLGMNETLQCEILVDDYLKSEVAIRWLKNGSEIVFTDEKRMEQVGNALRILDTRESDGGTYTCLATTSVDRDNKTLTLHMSPNDPTFIATWVWAPVAVIVLGITLTSVCFYRKWKNAVITVDELREFKLGSPSVQNDGIEEFTDGLPYDTRYELPFEKFQIDRDTVLGQGQFGIVYTGKVDIDGKLMKAAFKTTKSDGNNDTEATKRELKSLLSELKLLIYIGSHPHVIKIFGAYTKHIREGIVYVAIEFCDNGSLESILRRSGPPVVENSSGYPQEIRSNTNSIQVSIPMMSAWALQIAKGLVYLGSKKIIHSDLATRNVLVSFDMTIRITDFGLSRRLENYRNYMKMGVKELLPWRWTAIEALEEKRFSPESDIWSFGVTLWEIYAMGSIPYPGLSWTPDFIENLKQGERLTKPEYAADNVYEVMKKCWELDPSQRPGCSELVKFFQEISYADANVVYV